MTRWFMLRIIIWIYGCSLLLCALLDPVQRYSARVERLGPAPRAVLSETPVESYFPTDRLKWLELPPPWIIPRVIFDGDLGMEWHEKILDGGGSLGAYGTVVSRPDVPWTMFRISLTMACMACALWGVRILKRSYQMLERRGFEIQTAAKQTVREG